MFAILMNHFSLQRRYTLNVSAGPSIQFVTGPFLTKLAWILYPSIQMYLTDLDAKSEPFSDAEGGQGFWSKFPLMVNFQFQL